MFPFLYTRSKANGLGALNQTPFSYIFLNLLFLKKFKSILMFWVPYASNNRASMLELIKNFLSSKTTINGWIIESGVKINRVFIIPVPKCFLFHHSSKKELVLMKNLLIPLFRPTMALSHYSSTKKITVILTSLFLSIPQNRNSYVKSFRITINS